MQKDQTGTKSLDQFIEEEYGKPMAMARDAIDAIVKRKVMLAEAEAENEQHNLQNNSWQLKTILTPFTTHKENTKHGLPDNRIT